MSVDPSSLHRNRRPGPTVRTRVVEVRDGVPLAHEDRLATEEPLEIRLAWPGAPAQQLAVTMRTPGHDFELAAGWLVHEQVLAPGDLAGVRYCTDAELTDLEEFNVVTATSSAEPRRLPTPRAVSSACGVCGTDTIADLLRDLPPLPAGGPGPDLSLLQELPDRMRAEQVGFDRTGGLHAAGLFDASGDLVVVREDVGRHNAVDKVVGHQILTGAPVPEVLVLSGRVGFELVQKALVSGVGTIVAVGAPTSLAADLATAAGLGLVGFTRPDRCVVYAGRARFGV